MIETPETLDLSRRPEGAASWKIGSDGKPGPEGQRLPTQVWCGLALYPSRESAEAAIDAPARFMPFLDRTEEAWHAVLQPFAHKGECNILDASCPGELFDGELEDPGGALMVMTSAGFNLGPGFDIQRVLDFRHNVDRAREQAAAAEGNLAHQVFTPHTRGDDGLTMTIWRDDAAMFSFAYRPGFHRTQMDRYKVEKTADRSSFTRFRILRTTGLWQGRELGVATGAVAQSTL